MTSRNQLINKDTESFTPVGLAGTNSLETFRRRDAITREKNFHAYAGKRSASLISFVNEMDHVCGILIHCYFSSKRESFRDEMKKACHFPQSWLFLRLFAMTSAGILKKVDRTRS